jgi:hypothetical protein
MKTHTPIRITTTILALLLLSLTWRSVEGANPATPLTVVYPTGIFPADVQNVQAAVSKGGRVLLKAVDQAGRPLAFNFGTPENLPPNRGVGLSANVSLFGEWGRGDRTTIRGGYHPITSHSAIEASIMGIRFDGPLAGAILIGRSSGIKIIGNEIVNVVPRSLGGFSQSDGIDIAGSSSTDITGHITISGNTIENLTGDFALGIQLDRVWAKTEILFNTFQLAQTGEGGSVESSAILCARCNKAVSISGNLIRLGSGTAYSAIWIEGNSAAAYRVSFNVIESQSPEADGISVWGITAGDETPTLAPVIQNNSIAMQSTQYFGISLYGAVSQSTIQRNIITGDGSVALAVIDPFIEPSDVAVANRFLFNNIANFHASDASIYLDYNSVNTVVLGQCSTVIDLGTGNQVSCSTRVAHSGLTKNKWDQDRLQRVDNAFQAVRAAAQASR